MKCITREVTMYNYTFANIDVTTGQAHNISTVSRPTPFGARELAQFCKSHGDCVKIRQEEVTEKFSLPITEFVNACRIYAEAAEQAKAEYAYSVAEHEEEGAEVPPVGYDE